MSFMPGAGISRRRPAEAKKVLVVGGSSGGHIMPALALLDALGNKHPEVVTLLLVPKNNSVDKSIFAAYNVRYNSISALGLKFTRKNLLAAIGFIRGFFSALFLLLEFYPDAVVAFGSVISVPAVFWGWFFRRKVIIHEQNVLAGKANRFLAKFSDTVAVSFPETKKYFAGSSARIVFTGNPLWGNFGNESCGQAREFFGFGLDAKIILMMGGSSGSRRLNKAFLDTVRAQAGNKFLAVIHLTGYAECDEIKDTYLGLKINSYVCAFLKEMHLAYALSDLVICRAGATTVAELAHYQIPAILIPYPFAYRHQALNAAVLTVHGCALSLDDETGLSGKLSAAVADLLGNPGKLNLMRQRYRDMPQTDANDLLVKEVVSLY